MKWYTSYVEKYTPRDVNMRKHTEFFYKTILDDYKEIGQIYLALHNSYICMSCAESARHLCGVQKRPTQSRDRYTHL